MTVLITNIFYSKKDQWSKKCMTTLCLIISLGKKNKAILSIKAQKYQALKLKKKKFMYLVLLILRWKKDSIKFNTFFLVW